MEEAFLVGVPFGPDRTIIPEMAGLAEGRHRGF